MFRLMGKLWAQMKQIAPTLRYDARVMGGDFEVPTAELKKIKVPALAIWGSKAKPEMSKANAAIAEAIPGAGHRILDGQTHNVTPEALRPEIVGSSHEHRHRPAGGRATSSTASCRGDDEDVPRCPGVVRRRRADDRGQAGEGARERAVLPRSAHRGWREPGRVRLVRDGLGQARERRRSRRGRLRGWVRRRPST